MWHAEHTLDTTAEPGRVWQKVAEVAAWPEWDTELAWAKLPGPFSIGAQGTLKFRTEGPRAFRISAVVPERSFTTLMSLPLAEMRHTHSQEASAIGTRMTHRIEIVGALAWFYGWSRGRHLREALAPSMRKLAQVSSGG